MATVTTPAHAPDTEHTATAPIARMVLAQVRAVMIYYRRMPQFLFFSAALPIFFYIMFGLSAVERLPNGAAVGTLVMVHMGAYSVSSVLVFNIGIGQATRRAQKQDVLQRATPLPPWVAIAADALGGLMVSGVSLLVLFAFATVAGGVQLGLGLYVDLLVRLLIGALPILGLGLAIGYSVQANVAPAIANAIYLPLSFASGLFIPIDNLPSVVQWVAPYLPTYHYAQLVDASLGVAREGTPVAVLWLLAWGVVLFAAGIRAYRLDQLRKFS